MERLDIHVALEVCEIVIESATPVPVYVAQFPLARLTRMLPHSGPSGPPVHLVASPHFDSFDFCSG
jgi:hypothetical protein